MARFFYARFNRYFKQILAETCLSTSKITSTNLKTQKNYSSKQIKIQSKRGTIIFPAADNIIVSRNAKSDILISSFICTIINAAP